MERFNSELYDKYMNLKKRKFFEIEEVNKRNAAYVAQHQSAVEQVIEDLKTQNDNLLKKFVSMQEQWKEGQKLLLQEKQKTNLLSIELKALKEEALVQNKSMKITLNNTPQEHDEVHNEDSTSLKNGIYRKNSMLCDKSVNAYNQQECCRIIKKTNDGRPSPCAFHTLVELLVGMKFSVDCQTDELCLSVIHQMSGYNFTLSWVENEQGREEELLYRVCSMGTIESIALEWMKDDIIFSLAMCHLFFARLSTVFSIKC